MTASAVYDPQALTGYRLDQLASAFDRVRDNRDWKAPIRAIISADDRTLVEKAVLWFTETAPVFAPAPGEFDHLLVVADGYRIGTAEVLASAEQGAPAWHAREG